MRVLLQATFEIAGQAEVDQRDVVVFSQHHIGWLEIPMQDAGVMHDAQRRRDVLRRSAALRLR